MILLVSTQAQPFTQEMLRQLPNKLKQERIHATVQPYVTFIQNMILQEASVNRTSLNFTMYCIDPNRQYRESKKQLDLNHGRVPQNEEIYYSVPTYHPQGFSYQQVSYQNDFAYQRDGPRYRPSTNNEKHLETELIYPRPYCEPKRGYELYQRLYGNLEDTSTAYTTLFFQKLNTLFPDIHLAVSNHRPSEGLYDSDCCPLFTVSW